MNIFDVAKINFIVVKTVIVWDNINNTRNNGFINLDVCIFIIMRAVQFQRLTSLISNTGSKFVNIYRPLTRTNANRTCQNNLAQLV